MTFTEAVKTCFRKYVTFSGRASRPEYWWFFLFGWIGGLVFGFIEGFINGLQGDTGGPAILSNVFSLAIFIPSLAVGWRRMHDTGRSGLYLLYPLLIMIGIGTFVSVFGTIDSFLPGGTGGEPTAFQGFGLLAIALAGIVFVLSPLLVLWWLTRPSQPGTNEYGPDPHEVSS